VFSLSLIILLLFKNLAVVLPSFPTSERSTYCEGLSLSKASSPYEEILTVQYNITETLGRGSFGKVKLASHRLTGAQVAVKVLDKGEKGTSRF
jgi:serine/threonine protein kinase